MMLNSVMQLACRQAAMSGRKHFSLNNLKKLQCFAAFEDHMSSNILVNRRHSSLVIYNTDSHLCKNNNTISLDVPRRNRGLADHLNRTAYNSQKERKISRFIVLMRGAISEKGPNPNTNPTLSKVLEQMQKYGLPKADIKRYLDSATKKATSTHNVYYEIRGPIGTIFVLETETDNTKKCKDNLKSLLKKVPCLVPDHIAFQHLFDMKGTIEVAVTPHMQTSNMDEYLEIAIEAGAEDVILARRDENDPNSEMVLVFHCEPKTLTTVTREIEETHNLEIASSKVLLHPHNWVTVESEDDIATCKKIVQKLQTHPDFVALFDNVFVPKE